MISKYKVWDKEFGVMRTPYQIGVSGGYHTFWSFDKTEIVRVYYNPDRYVVIQCTGAKDMDGTDIYEGDIIRKEICSPDDIAFGHYGDIGVIKYDSSVMGFIIDSEDDGFYDNNGMNFSFDRIEIVGNIYENPEKLE